MAILCRHLVQSVGEGRIGMENETDSALQLSFREVHGQFWMCLEASVSIPFQTR